MFHRILLLVFLFLSCSQAGNADNSAVTFRGDRQAPAANNNAAAKWPVFWKNFTGAINTRDKISIAKLSSPEFYDGGGSTIDQWLDAEVFTNEKNLAHFKATLGRPVKTFKGFDGSPYKATGKNKPGDLFFEYKKGQWLFGGMVGD